MLWWLARTIVSGIDNIPKKGGVIFCPNHHSSFDQFFLGPNIFRARRKAQKIYFIADHRVRPWVPKLTAKYLGILFKSSHRDFSVLDYAVKVIKKGFPFVIFFEGKRRTKGEIPEPKTGAYRLHLLTNAPIVPVWIEAFDSSSFRKGFKGFLKAMFLKKVKIVFGKPLPVLMENEKDVRVLLASGIKSPELYEYLKLGAKKLQQEVQKLAPSSTKKP
jgi:1-acyl-sn-glycerol-3-phosphate acyltransferase